MFIYTVNKEGKKKILRCISVFLGQVWFPSCTVFFCLLAFLGYDAHPLKFYFIIFKIFYHYHRSFLFFFYTAVYLVAQYARYEMRTMEAVSYLSFFWYCNIREIFVLHINVGRCLWSSYSLFVIWPFNPGLRLKYFLWNPLGMKHLVWQSKKTRIGNSVFWSILFS